MKLFLKYSFFTFAVLAGLVLLFILYIQLSYTKKFKDIPYLDTKAITDSAVIAWGKYLVYGPAHCAMCHADKGQQGAVDSGEEVPLIGGIELHKPIGVLRPGNLTSDKETGIGNLTDVQIARVLRFNIMPDGEAISPVMAYQQLSEDDMVAVISYLRTLPPVRHEVKPSEYNFTGKLVKSFIIEPAFPTDTPAKVKRDSFGWYGWYLAIKVANCYGCHTNRNLKTLDFISKPFAGGLTFLPEPEYLNYGFVSANLTSDKATGSIAGWSKKAFVDRMRKGSLQNGSPMPWGPYSRMAESDLKAIYTFLHSVDSVKNKIPKTVYLPGEAMPKPKY